MISTDPTYRIRAFPSGAANIATLSILLALHTQLLPGSRPTPLWPVFTPLALAELEYPQVT